MESMGDSSTNDNLVSIERAILADVCLGLPLGKIVFRVPGHMEPVEIGAVPDTFLFRGEQLALMKALHARGEEPITEAISALARSADNAMRIAPFSVTQKPRPRFSDDPHDYQSLAKYWWPNPDTASGLPYVKRDGEVNPECYSENFDYVRLTQFSDTVTLLAVAAYLTGRVKYGKRAGMLLETWFVDPRTRQTPHFNFAQMEPGDAPHWRGVIEARFLIYVTEAMQLLAKTGALTARIRRRRFAPGSQHCSIGCASRDREDKLRSRATISASGTTCSAWFMRSFAASPGWRKRLSSTTWCHV